jgi:hypothetical protein
MLVVGGSNNVTHLAAGRWESSSAGGSPSHRTVGFWSHLDGLTGTIQKEGIS